MSQALLLQIEGLEADEEKQERKKFYEKRSFWTFRVPLVWMLVFVFIGVLLRVYEPLKVHSSEIQLCMSADHECELQQNVPAVSKSRMPGIAEHK